MQHENVDKDPDLRKSSDLEPNDKSLVPRLITVGALLAVITGTALVLIYYSPNWGPSQWGDVATWVAGIATSLAVIVAVWQTNNANKQTRAAEKRAEVEAAKTEERHREQMATETARYEADTQRIEKESRDRQREEVRQREYDAVQAILDALGRLVAEVYNHVRTVETSTDITKTLTSSTDLLASQKTKYAYELIIRNETSQMELLRTTNNCMMTVRTAMFQVTSHNLIQPVSNVFKNMQEAAKCFTTADKDNDWDEAVRKINTANEAGIELQKTAGYRFFPTDDEVPSELPIEFAIQPERRESTDHAEEPATS